MHSFFIIQNYFKDKGYDVFVNDHKVYCVTKKEIPIVSFATLQELSDFYDGFKCNDQTNTWFDFAQQEMKSAGWTVTKDDHNGEVIINFPLTGFALTLNSIEQFILFFEGWQQGHDALKQRLNQKVPTDYPINYLVENGFVINRNLTTKIKVNDYSISANGICIGVNLTHKDLKGFALAFKLGKQYAYAGGFLNNDVTNGMLREGRTKRIPLEEYKITNSNTNYFSDAE